MEIRKLTPHIGAEVLDVDLARLDEAAFKALHDALIENCVIFFRDQQLTVDQHKAFGRRFGELHMHPAAPRELPGAPLSPARVAHISGMAIWLARLAAMQAPALTPT